MRKASLSIIFVTIFIDLLSFGIIIPIMPFYAEHFGASATEIGMLAASFSFMQFLFSPFWGRLSDRFGRRPVLLISLAGSGFALMGVGFARSLTALFVARACAGIFTANIATAQAYIADITSPENRARGMGMIGAAFGLGFTFGPAIGGLLSDEALLSSAERFLSLNAGISIDGLLSSNNLSIPSFAAAGLALLNTAAAFFFLPESLSMKKMANARQEDAAPRVSRLKSFKIILSQPIVGQFLVIFFLVTLAFTKMETTYALMTERNFGFGPGENGYLFAFIGIVLSITNGLLIGPLTRRYGEKTLLPIGLLLQALAFFFLPYSFSVTGLLIFSGIIAVGSGFSNPSLQSLISRSAARDEQGLVLGFSHSLGSLARIFGPLWGGFFFDKLGVPAPYLSGGIIILLGVWLSMRAASKFESSNAA